MKNNATIRFILSATFLVCGGIAAIYDAISSGNWLLALMIVLMFVGMIWLFGFTLAHIARKAEKDSDRNWDPDDDRFGDQHPHICDH